MPRRSLDTPKCSARRHSGTSALGVAVVTLLTALAAPAAGEEKLSEGAAASGQTEAYVERHANEGDVLVAGSWRRGEAFFPAVVVGVRAARLPGGPEGTHLLGLLLFTKRAPPAGTKAEPSLRIAPLRLAGGAWGVLAEATFD